MKTCERITVAMDLAMNLDVQPYFEAKDVTTAELVDGSDFSYLLGEEFQDILGQGSEEDVEGATIIKVTKPAKRSQASVCSISQFY